MTARSTPPRLRMGVDVGGTKMEGVVLDADGGEVWRRRVATPREDYDGSLAAVADLVRAAEGDLGCGAGGVSVGLGIPGCISPASRMVKNANSTWMNGRAMDRDLARVLGRAVRMENDANCLAVSEAVDGAAAGAKVALALILGTGAGAGIAIGGRAHRGRHVIAGEWGHNPLPWAGEGENAAAETCFCGKRGCLETWVSGSGVARDYQRATGREASADEIMARMREGEGEAGACYRRLISRLARGVAAVINILDPDVIVIGGGLSRAGEIYRDLPAALPGWVFSDECTTPLRPALHGDASGVRGAAWLWNDGNDV